MEYASSCSQNLLNSDVHLMGVPTRAVIRTPNRIILERVRPESIRHGRGRLSSGYVHCMYNLRVEGGMCEKELDTRVTKDARLIFKIYRSHFLAVIFIIADCFVKKHNL